jgi:hypothetical protein
VLEHASHRESPANLPNSKLQSHANGLIQHLKSPAHMEEKLRCPGCLRQFNSATALVQHAESQAIKCNIRKTSEYRQAVDQITGGFVDTKGRHADDTVRYIAIQDMDGLNIKDINQKYWDKKDAEMEDLLRKQMENVEW